MPAPKGHANYAKAPNLGGRPPKFSKEDIEKEAEYFYEWLQEPTSIFFKHFATIRGYCAQYLTKFAEKNERFREVYNYAKTVQETKLMMGGLFKKLDSGLVKFTMANHHGYSDKQIVISQTNELDSILKNLDGKSKEIVNESNKSDSE
jgi:hypothetical protein